MRLCTWKNAIYKFWFTNLQLQSCNVSMFRIQSTKIAFTKYKTTFFKFRFTSLKWHNTHVHLRNNKPQILIYKFASTCCNVRILTPLAFHTNLPSVSYMTSQVKDAISGRKPQKGGKSFRKLKYWSFVQPKMLLQLPFISEQWNHSQATRCIIFDTRGTRGLKLLRILTVVNNLYASHLHAQYTWNH